MLIGLLDMGVRLIKCDQRAAGRASPLLCYNAVNKQGIARESEDMGGIGVPELLIVLVIVIIVFGVGRIGKVGKELGTGIREFRKGLTGDEEKPAAQNDKPQS
jgi:sec-independent protein translocase protein TatA